MSAVPASLREGAFGLGASKLQVSLRIVFPAALRASSPRSSSAPRARWGETVIILIAGGQTANLGVDPRESYQSMAAFIAATARGDIPTGSIEYETIFVVGFTLFCMTLLLNAVSIRPRAPLPAGLRMTGAQIAASARSQKSVLPAVSGRDRLYGRLFRLVHVPGARPWPSSDSARSSTTSRSAARRGCRGTS